MREFKQVGVSGVIDKLFRVPQMLGFDFESTTTLKRYQKEFEEVEKIGAGGFSTVYRVRNKRDDRQYALKVLKIKPSQYKGELADDLDKVLGEGKVLATLNHPNVLQYFGSWMESDPKLEQWESSEDSLNESRGEEEELQMVFSEGELDSCGIQFQKVSSRSQKKKESQKNEFQKNDSTSDNFFGTNLRQFKEIRILLLSELGHCSLQRHVQNRNQLSHKTVQETKQRIIQNYEIILDIIEGLSYIHNQKIIHRDIKMENIIRARDGRFKIIDFGLAKKVRALKSLEMNICKEDDYSNQDEVERHSKSIGTRIFSSPEQTTSNSYDHRTDIYSLALIIGLLFSDCRTLHEQIDILTSLRHKQLDGFDIDERLKEIMLLCLSEEERRTDLKTLKKVVKKLLKETVHDEQNLNSAFVREKYCLQSEKDTKKQPLQESFLCSQNHYQTSQNKNKRSEIEVPS